MKKPAFVNTAIYHIYNRGVEKRNVFLDDKDRLRFIHDLFEFNDSDPTINSSYYFMKQSIEVQPRYTHKTRKLLVKILAFCLMPNHYHFLVEQHTDNGVVNFMQKLGTGYTMYFNQKYNRVGPLFQGRFKAILIEKDSHFIHLPYYIHLNPLDLIMPEWRRGEIKNYKKAMQFLETYRWSSFPDYIGKKNFPSVTQRDFLLNFFEGPREYKKATLEWLKAINLTAIEDQLLE